MMTKECGCCGGRGWIGYAVAGDFPSICAMALAGKLPKKPCPVCDGTGREPLNDQQRGKP